MIDVTLFVVRQQRGRLNTFCRTASRSRAHRDAGRL